MPKFSVVIPAKDEELGLKTLLPELRAVLTEDSEIIVVNDGSSDSTGAVCKENSVTQIIHPYSKGNGASIKAGARIAKGEYLIFMDGDGQHAPEDIRKLIARLDDGYDLVVGARTKDSQASLARSVANSFYNRFASFVTGHKISDLTSGFRVVRADKFREFLYLLPNGFSYPTTSTMAFFRAGYSVSFEEITANAREGKSHINIVKDGVRFLLIIFKVGTLYSPLKVFFPISLLAMLSGLGWYGYTLISFSRFTNMSALLMSTSLIIFLMGLISEQITSLLYKDS